MADDNERPNYPRKTKRTRAPLTPATYREIRRRIALGDLQQDIAADLGINQGRVSEVKNGKRGGDDRQALLL